jgi:hypothetical protein
MHIICEESNRDNQSSKLCFWKVYFHPSRNWYADFVCSDYRLWPITTLHSYTLFSSVLFLIYICMLLLTFCAVLCSTPTLPFYLSIILLLSTIELIPNKSFFHINYFIFNFCNYFILFVCVSVLVENIHIRKNQTLLNILQEGDQSYIWINLVSSSLQNAQIETL